MTPKELFDAGQLAEAIQALGAELRQHPDDTGRRWFLFELLCFSGDYGRAEKQLDVVASAGEASQKTADFYRAVLFGERTRQEMFEKGDLPGTAGEEVSLMGILNSRKFESLAEDDPRIGDRLEMFVNGSYLWMPFQHIATVEMAPPRRLRDLLWAPAEVRSTEALGGRFIDGVLLPLLAPLTWKHSDEAVRLGRLPSWEETPDGRLIPSGHKIWLVDGVEFQLPDLRKLEFDPISPS